MLIQRKFELPFGIFVFFVFFYLKKKTYEELNTLNNIDFYIIKFDLLVDHARPADPNHFFGKRTYKIKNKKDRKGKRRSFQGSGL